MFGIEKKENPNVDPMVFPQHEKGSWWERLTGEKLKRSEKIAGVVFLLVFLFVFYITLDANKYRAEVRVIEGEGKIGVNPTTESLDFGDLSRGTQAIRTVTIKNASPTPLFVSVITFGTISDLVKLDHNNFKLARDAEQKIEFTLYMPASAEIDKQYTGRVFIFKIPTPFF